MLFNNWEGLLRTLVVGVLAYFALLVLLRVSGKRTLSKMNAFDFVVTIAIGSTLATVLLSKTVALAEGVLAFGLLIGLQFLITWLSVRSTTISQLVKAEPTMLFYRNRFLSAALRKERVTESEVLQAIRQSGIDSREKVEAVVLETDGSFSIIATSPKTGESALSNVNRMDADAA